VKTQDNKITIFIDTTQHLVAVYRFSFF